MAKSNMFPEEFVGLDNVVVFPGIMMNVMILPHTNF